MKVLIVNYRYFVSGGPETYMFNVIDALKQLGHEVIPYSIRYSINEPSEYSKYFAEPISSNESVYFEDHDGSLRTKFKAIQRSFYDKGVEKSIRRCVQETKPDVALVLHYKRKLSPAVLVGLKKEKIPVIVRFSDFLAICPQSLLLRNGKPCIECIEKNSIFPSLIHKCVKNSLGASIIHYISEKYHNLMKFNDIPAFYIVPSNFTRTKLAEAGYCKEKLIVLPTFAPSKLFSIKRVGNDSKSKKILYAGNLESYKGIHIALDSFMKAVERLPYGSKLIIAGKGTEKKAIESLIKKYALDDQVEMVGFIDSERLLELYKQVDLTIVPSICYENLPNALIESMACGIPVIGSGHGSIEEHITNGVTGYCAEPGNINAWADLIVKAVENSGKLVEIGINAKDYSKKVFNQKHHIERLVELFHDIAL